MKPFGRSAPAGAETSAAIRLADSDETREESSWGRVLVVFMRAAAVLWMAQGLSYWGAILTPREPLFDRVGGLFAAAVVFFAILDLVVAVGLWLASSWGGVLWLFAAVAQIAAVATIEGFAAKAWIGVNVVLIILYFGLTWQAGRDRDETRRSARK